MYKDSPAKILILSEKLNQFESLSLYRAKYPPEFCLPVDLNSGGFFFSDMSGLLSQRVDELFAALLQNAPVTTSLIQDAKQEYDKIRVNCHQLSPKREEKMGNVC